MTVDFSSILEERWAALASRTPTRTRGFRTASLDVVTIGGPVLVAIDVTGGKHLLLPLGEASRPAPDTSGRAVHLLLRKLGDEKLLRWYLDVALLEDRLSSVFTVLCEDVLQGVAEHPDAPARVTRSIVRDWRALLSAGDRPLDSRVLSGLHGELIILLRLLQKDSSAASWWVGPSGATHDFVRGTRALEVKTTVAPVGRGVRIHGIDQLDGPPGGLLLVWFRLSSHVDGGQSVPDLVEAVLKQTDDRHKVEAALLRLGYIHDRAHPEHDVQFSIVDERAYNISVGFPRLIPGDLAGDATLGGLADIHYTVDLDSPPALKMRTETLPTSFLLENQ